MEAVGLSLDRLIITWSHLKASLSLIMIFIPVFFLLRLVVVSFASAENRTHSGPEILNFDYRQSSRQGPLFWHNVNTTGNEWEIYRNKPEINLDVPGNECKSTRRPSPINLVANAECSDGHEILTRRIKSTDCHFDSLAFSVTPHTLRADFPFDDSTCQRPTIDMPNGYPFTWFVHHIEVHLRAEHVLDGRRYDGEMQMYHLGREDQKRELAAVAVLLDASGLHDDPRLQQYIEAWKVAANETEIKCAAQRQLRTTRKTTSRRTPVQDKEFYLDHGKYSLHFFKSFNITRAVDHPEHSTRHLTEELDGWGPRRKMFVSLL
jgi:carbonic anhydrase